MKNLISIKDLKRKVKFRFLYEILNKKYFYVMINIATTLDFYHNHRYTTPQYYPEIQWCDENNIARTPVLSWTSKNRFFPELHVTVFLRFDNEAQYNQFILTFNDNASLEMKMDQIYIRSIIKKMFFMRIEDIFDL